MSPTVPETAALPPASAVDSDPASVMGLGQDALAAHLGEPRMIRREPPAEIWQYRTSDCVLDVFLYEENGATSVTYIEARDLAAAPTETRACIGQVLRDRQTVPVS